MVQPLAFFGGSFDPPHVGHVLAVHYVLLTAPVERVLVIPSAQHPFGKGEASYADRLEMCRLAFRALGEAAPVLDIEGRREGTSFTIDTVRELRRLYPGAPLRMVVGSDLLDEIRDWKDSEALLEQVELLPLPRQGAPAPEGSDFFCLPEVSSSEIRERLTGRDPGLAERLPAAVLAFIEKRGLYRD